MFQVNGFSKSHAMTGYRLGYVAAPPIITKVGPRKRRFVPGRTQQFGPGACCFLSPTHSSTYQALCGGAHSSVGRGEHQLNSNRKRWGEFQREHGAFDEALRAPLCLCFQAVTTIQGQITSCASSISQAAGLAALAVSDDDMQVSFDVMRKKVGRGQTDMIDVVGVVGCIAECFSRECLARRGGGANKGAGMKQVVTDPNINRAYLKGTPYSRGSSHCVVLRLRSTPGCRGCWLGFLSVSPVHVAGTRQQECCGCSPRMLQTSIRPCRLPVQNMEG